MEQEKLGGRGQERLLRGSVEVHYKYAQNIV